VSRFTFNHSNNDGRQTIAVFGSYGDTAYDRIVTQANPSFVRLATYLASTPDGQHDAEYVHGLVDPSIGIGRFLQEEFGDRVTFDTRHFYVDGVKETGALANHVKDMVMSGSDDWARFARFLVNLLSNPSRRAQEAVWKWVEGNGLTITEDGRFLGYKGVSAEGTSISSGPNNFVDGVLYKEGKTTVVPYAIGTVVSKRRQDVDDTPGGGCSVGLHVGTESYAKGWGPRTITVAINPADVVSAPDHDLSWKIRVCALEVISEADDEQFAGPSYDLNPEPAPEPEVEGDLEDERSLVEVVADETDAITEPVTLEEAVASYQAANPHWDVTTLPDIAGSIPALKADLADKGLGHKPLARRWAPLTTEASVRRYRKSNGISLNLGTKVKDALS
jgi:hypothetical protein